MQAFRLTRKKFSKDPFSGMGAKTFGGRWNSKGVECLYCSQAESLCILEVLVHVRNDPKIVALYDLYLLDIPDGIISVLNNNDLPQNWRDIPVNESTQYIGDDFIQDPENPFAVLKVASVISPRDNNLVVNPNHKAMIGVFAKARKIEFEFDLRIFG